MRGGSVRRLARDGGAAAYVEVGSGEFALQDVLANGRDEVDLGVPLTSRRTGFLGTLTVSVHALATLQALQAKWRAAGRRIMLYTENLFAKHGGSAKVRYHFDA